MRCPDISGEDVLHLVWLTTTLRAALRDDATHERTACARKDAWLTRGPVDDCN